MRRGRGQRKVEDWFPHNCWSVLNGYCVTQILAMSPLRPRAFCELKLKLSVPLGPGSYELWHDVLL